MEQPYMLHILHCQYHDCWCPGDFKSPGHQQSWYWQNKPEYSIFSIRRVMSYSPPGCFEWRFQSSIGSGYGLVQNRHQAITCTNTIRHHQQALMISTQSRVLPVKLPWIFLGAHWLSMELLEIQVCRVYYTTHDTDLGHMKNIWLKMHFTEGFKCIKLQRKYMYC